MIVATAGHVDHGKTALVKALTGIDTDRLPEEKRRGLTIDLGFAYLPASETNVIGFVDVPGHERFIHNMLCGVSGIDLALVVVAADDGPMPQTREHVAILDLLDVCHGVLVVTKVDRVSAERAAEVAAQMQGILRGTSLAGAPTFPVSALTGSGMAALKSHLLESSLRLAPRSAEGNFRLCVDRVFTKAGAGLVATGTVMSGAITAGDRVCALLSGVEARVRAIHAQSRPAERAAAGERCALNLAATAGRQAIERGDWIVSGEVAPPARKIDVLLRLLASEAKPLVHWTPVHVHLGASDVTGRIALLEADDLAPGASALAQLVLEQPIGAVHGDRFIVRDQSARRTLGGGRVLDMFPPPRGRARPERLAWLRAMQDSDPQSALVSVLPSAPAGVDLAGFAANRNLAPSAASRLRELAARVVSCADRVVAFDAARWRALRSTAIASLEAAHRRDPDVLAVPEARVFDGTGVRVAAEVVAALCEELLAEGLIAREPVGIRLAAHRPVLAATDAALWAKARPFLDSRRPPSLAELAVALGRDARQLETALTRLARHGLIVRVSKSRFFTPSALLELGRLAAEEAQEKGAISAAGFRDRSGIGRNLSIEVLEYFDRVKFTRRAGPVHVLSPASRIVGHFGRDSHPGGAPGLQIQ